jgi:hypothetical protein
MVRFLSSPCPLSNLPELNPSLSRYVVSVSLRLCHRSQHRRSTPSVHLWRKRHDRRQRLSQCRSHRYRRLRSSCSCLSSCYVFVLQVQGSLCRDESRRSVLPLAFQDPNFPGLFLGRLKLAQLHVWIDWVRYRSHRAEGRQQGFLRLSHPSEGHSLGSSSCS